MSPGSVVIYLEDPLLYGRMLLLEVHQDGRLLCESIRADKHGEHARDLFDAHELETAEKWGALDEPAAA